MQRREFLLASAVAGAGLATGAVQAGPVQTGPRNLRAGVIGTGWYGMVDCRHLIREGGERVEVTSLCDADANHLRDAAGEIERMTKRRPQTFRDFREMLKGRNLDVVIVGTPDHWHALTAVAALEAGADVYVEKPICHTYLEG